MNSHSPAGSELDSSGYRAEGEEMTGGFRGFMAKVTQLILYSHSLSQDFFNSDGV